ncbi:hypothetical protein K239x_10280 [Planctomycetes bacterium K23_9]|uniref:Uncharacterized protein n=1 Tax=Stieleria marina TaxID=1930275 RepID=A0A517NPM7_9BACT|nr:hypothetical protein K239x_10280 [Planctomycetes bacterium K23_9]
MKYNRFTSERGLLRTNLHIDFRPCVFSLEGRLCRITTGNATHSLLDNQDKVGTN